MQRLESINSERLLWCCEDYGITLQDLASETGIAQSSIETFADDGRGLTISQLRRIADFFGKSVLFFLEHGPVDEALAHTPEFRTLANQKPDLSPKMRRLIERAERQRNVYLSLIEDLDEGYRQLFNPPSVPVKNPQSAASIARDWLEIDERNYDFERYREAIEARGILVFRSNGYNGDWKFPDDSPVLGFSLYHKECPIIVVKKQRVETRQTFTLVHELGHILLHRSSWIDDAADLQSREGAEQAANTFAGNFLVPNSVLNAIKDASRPNEVAAFDDWLESHRKKLGVSGEVILRRLLDAGRLPQNTYAAYRKWRESLPLPESSRGSREYRYREPIHIFGSSFVQAVLDALNTQQISLARASSHLDGLKIKDLHKLENYHAGA